MSNGNGKTFMSRKWKLALLVVLLATIGAFIPPVVSAWLMAAETPLVVISGTEWVSVISLVVGLYIGGNVWQKKIEANNGSPSEPGEEDRQA